MEEDTQQEIEEEKESHDADNVKELSNDLNKIDNVIKGIKKIRKKAGRPKGKKEARVLYTDGIRLPSEKSVLKQLKLLQKRVFLHMTDNKLKQSSAGTLAKILGILDDKIRLHQGQPTSINAYQKRINILADVATREEDKEEETSGAENKKIVIHPGTKVKN